MNRSLSVAAFVLGAAVVGWVGAGYVGRSPLALGMTALIGLVYLGGALELLRFERATSALRRALDAIPPDLPDAGAWLRSLPASLQNAVRLRLEGERVGLPGPALAPYLVGLLVLLGMLGTFLGMVMTLDGAVLALETTTDLPTIRAALAAPVKGLGVAFGTSVAGVAASAMLGLISALVRRARAQVSQVLDSRIARELRGFSLAQQRLDAFRAMQEQARSLPVLVETVQAMMAQMARQQSVAHERMASAQQRFHDEAGSSYTALAAAVDASLKESLVESARLAGRTIEPLVADAMAGIARETHALQQRVADGVQAQLEGASQCLDTAVARVSAGWTAALAQHEQRSMQLLASHERSAEALADALHDSLQRFAQTFDERAAALVERVGATMAALQSSLAASTQEQAGQSIAQAGALMQAAAEAPRMAAEVIAELRQAYSVSAARENAALDERARLMETLRELLDAINRASLEQRQAIDDLVASSATALQRAAGGFEQRMEDEASRLADTAGELAGGAVEVASLAEGFGQGVQLFSDASARLMTSLERIEGALERAMKRSDEQLAYYVAQARELIDLSLMSQQRIVDDLQQRSGRSSSAGG